MNPTEERQSATAQKRSYKPLSASSTRSRSAFEVISDIFHKTMNNITFVKNMYLIITDIIVRILGDVFNLWPSDRWFRKTCSSFQRRDILRNLFRHVWTKLHEVDPYYFNAFSYKFLSSLASKNQIFYIKIHCPVAFCLKTTCQYILNKVNSSEHCQQCKENLHRGIFCRSRSARSG